MGLGGFPSVDMDAQFRKLFAIAHDRVEEAAYAPRIDMLLGHVWLIQRSALYSDTLGIFTKHIGGGGAREGSIRK